MEENHGGDGDVCSENQRIKPQEGDMCGKFQDEENMYECGRDVRGTGVGE